jgi:WD40 repeat protein
MLTKATLFTALSLSLLTHAASTDPLKTKGRPGREAAIKPRLILPGHTGPVWCVQYSPDGERLATASGDRTAALWDVSTGKRLHLLEGHTRPILDLAFAPRGDRLATGALDGTARVWDTATGRSTALLTGEDGPIFGVAFDPTGQAVATTSTPREWESGLRVWDARTGKRRPGFHAWGQALTRVSWSGDGRWLVVGDRKGELTIWNAVKGEVARTLRGHRGLIKRLAWSPDSQRLATAGADGTTRVWELVSGQESLRLDGQMPTVSGVAFLPGGRQVVLTAYELMGTRSMLTLSWSEVRVWDPQTGEVKTILKFNEHGQWTYGLAVTFCGTRLATGHEDGTGKIWSMKELLARAQPRR